MRIKKFVGTTLQDATGQMKAELGDNAIILNTRKVHKGGVLSFTGKEMFEITAAVDNETSPATNSYAFARDGSAAANAYQQHGKRPMEKDLAQKNTMEGLADVAQEFRQRQRHTGAADPRQPRTPDLGGLHELKGEVEDMKATLLEIAGHIKYARMPALSEALKQAYVNLIQQDVDEHVAAELVQKAYIRLGEQAADDDSAVEQHVLETLGARFRVAGPGELQSGKSRVIALVGPTGVGKTTTIAKLAAKRKLTDGLSVGLISADTYRIGAIEQLQTFAAIADIPLEVVYEASEIEQALERFKGKDVVYIDTVGRSHYNSNEVAEVAEFVARARAEEVHLVLSAPTQERTLMASVDRFSVVKPTRLLLTKTDEAASFGSVLALANDCPLAFSFLATGQSVPDDIVAARPADLAMMVYKGVIPHA